MPTKNSSKALTLVGIACRDPHGVSTFAAYVGETFGEWRQHRESARRDLDKMMRTNKALAPWGWGPTRIVQ